MSFKMSWGNTVVALPLWLEAMLLAAFIATAILWS